MIKIENIELRSYNKFDKEILEEILQGESKSDFIHQIDERLINSREVEQLELSNAYLVCIDGKTVGYIYLTGMSKNYIYLEYLILKKYRHKGIGRYVVEQVSDEVFRRFPHLKEIKLNIDRSNIGSINLAEAIGFYDDGNYGGQKIDFIKDNPYYIEPKRKA